MPGILPIGHIACQANFASPSMAVSEQSREPWRMGAPRKQAHPQPTLRLWRKHRGLTLEQVGERVGVTGQTVHKWEAGKVPVTLENLRLLAEALDTTPARLLAPPSEAHIVDRLARAQKVLTELPEERALRWLSMGEDLAATAAPEKK